MVSPALRSRKAPHGTTTGGGARRRQALAVVGVDNHRMGLTTPGPFSTLRSMGKPDKPVKSDKPRGRGRGRGVGTISVRPAGSFRAQVNIHGERIGGTFPNYEAADAWLRKVASYIAGKRKTIPATPAVRRGPKRRT